MHTITKIDRQTINSLDEIIGVYIFYHNKDFQYIGKSVNIKARLLSHLENAKTDIKERLIIENSNKIYIIPTNSEFNAIILEANLIKKHLPKYNRIWKDDKSFIYIKITIKEKYPKLKIVRKPSFAKTSNNEDQSLYFGPYSSSFITQILIKEIRRVFPYCSSNKIAKSACFYHKIGLCNPCPNEIEKIENKQLKQNKIKDYKNNIKQIIKVLNGQSDSITENLHNKIKKYTKLQQFEQAIKARDLIYYFKNLITNRIHIVHDYPNYNIDQSSILLLNTLNKYFPNLKKLNRIECYDISNLYFQFSTASMVVFNDGKPNKSQYRRFKIKNLKLHSDFEMFNEIIHRRFNNKWQHPDLIVIDGGKPQIRTVLQVLSDIKTHVPVIGIAKNPDRIIIGSQNLISLRFVLNNPGFNIIRYIRDESHRFAKKYHLLLRNRKFLL